MPRQISIPGTSPRTPRKLLVAVIRERLRGYEMRQLVREQKRRQKGSKWIVNSDRQMWIFE